MTYSDFKERYALPVCQRSDYKELEAKNPNITVDEAINSGLLHCVPEWDYDNMIRSYKAAGSTVEELLKDAHGWVSSGEVIKRWNNDSVCASD